MKLYDISADIAKAIPYPGDRKTEIIRTKSLIDGDDYNLSEICLSAHIGTHIDAPLHYCRGGETVADMDLSAFYGACNVISITGILTGEHMDKILPYANKRILINGGGYAYLSSSAVNVLAEHGVVLVGIDSASVGVDYEDNKVHTMLLKNKIAILEGLNLNGIKDGEYVISAFPLKISGCEAAPCRAVLIEHDKFLWF